MLSIDSELKVSADASACIQEEGIVIIHSSKGLIFSANSVGAQIWQAIQAGKSVANISAGLSGRYGIVKNTADRDCLAFCQELMEADLVGVAGLSPCFR